MAERNKLLRKLQAAKFAAWELHLYLDTHPCDKAANEMFRKYTNEAKMLKKEFEDRFGPLSITNSNEADWLCDPWPWDFQGSCD